MTTFDEINDVAKRIFFFEGGDEKTWTATDEVERNYFRKRAEEIIQAKAKINRSDD